jgi:hypothetical protein
MGKLYFSQDAIDQNGCPGLFPDLIKAFSLFAVLSDSYPYIHQTLEKFTAQDLVHSSRSHCNSISHSITHRVFTLTP